ncbi:hypothetical protein BV96_02022 [Sphingomonas paucimobilis]|uniref:hypothetical protein n=1 Tax=Sphingobium sp. DC-2 TaxID=1303256 RepID=UPI0004509BFD|nr:hypothetical protein [Sphingobium sp. DC-2]EZP71892.1 hypothetical protein BV96_02022 [Sphingomonas paucimobilis]
MDGKHIEMEKAWEQALGNIFTPYTGADHDPVRKAINGFASSLGSSSYEIRRHMARTAARQGSMALGQCLADEYWGKRP